MTHSDSSTFDTPPVPVLQHRMMIEVTIGDIVPVGPTPTGLALNFPITGGRFQLLNEQGNLIHGQVVAGGADFFREGPDGVGIMNAIYTLCSDAGQHFNIRNQGVFRITREGKQQQQQGIWPVDASLISSLCRPEFNAPEGELYFLNHLPMIGQVGYPATDRVVIQLFALPEALPVD